MEINNFGQVMDDLLEFDKPGEFYMAMVLRRRKDTAGAMAEGVNEDNRLIKHYFIYDREYLERKADSIIALCRQNNARAYILPQRRTCRLTLWNLHDKVSETLKAGAMNVHFDHLIRSCVAGMHETPSDAKWHKRWVIDIDADDPETVALIKAWRESLALGTPEETAVEDYVVWLRNKISVAVSCEPGTTRHESARAYIKEPGAMYGKRDFNVIKTPHGFHVVTPPFNRDPKMMEEYFGVGTPRSYWIKFDAMTLMYAPDEISGSTEIN